MHFQPYKDFLRYYDPPSLFNGDLYVSLFRNASEQATSQARSFVTYNRMGNEYWGHVHFLPDLRHFLSFSWTDRLVVCVWHVSRADALGRVVLGPANSRCETVVSGDRQVLFIMKLRCLLLL